MGIRQPRIESNESIAKFLAKAGIKSDKVFHVDSAFSYSFWMDVSRAGRPIDLKIYNGKGFLLKKFEQDQCSGIYSDQIAEMDLIGSIPLINEENVAEELQKFKTLDGRKLTLQSFDETEFIACISYTDAFGKSALENIVNWTNSIKKNKSADKIEILYMNMDMHASWGIQSRKDPRRMKFDY